MKTAMTVEAATSETALEAGGYAKGVAVALVTQNKDDEGLCRVKVRYPWHDKPRESYWARLADADGRQGSRARVHPGSRRRGLVGFEREDLRFPYVLGALWNGKDKPPLANDDGKNDKRIRPVAQEALPAVRRRRAGRGRARAREGPEDRLRRQRLRGAGRAGQRQSRSTATAAR